MHARGAREMDDRARTLAGLLQASPHNLLSRRERDAAAVHVAESEALAPYLPLRDGARWLDLGTGGGLPGLVLAWVAPTVSWTLLDSTTKKTRAVTRFVASLNLDNVAVVNARAEDAAHEQGHRGRYDGVVSRAVAPLPVLAEYARGFLRPGGVLAAVKGPHWQAELDDIARALPTLRLAFVSTAGVTSAARPTVVVILRAEGPPPPGFPRRAGLPRRQPLGGTSA
jgi:16S rRNA (guanine527-N7)-methyltransferase